VIVNSVVIAAPRHRALRTSCFSLDDQFFMVRVCQPDVQIFGEKISLVFVVFLFPPPGRVFGLRGMLGKREFPRGGKLSNDSHFFIYFKFYNKTETPLTFFQSFLFLIFHPDVDWTFLYKDSFLNES